MKKTLLNGEAVFVIRKFLTPQECDAFVARSEEAGFEDATITTAAGSVMNKNVRDNSRLMQDDPALAALLWKRAEPFLPPSVQNWRVVGLNERFRYYRYDPGQKFAPHGDGAFKRPSGEQSWLTFMVYLNDDFSGGETKFYEDVGVLRLSVKPERGMALVFLHRQLHEGAAIVSGRKYVPPDGRHVRSSARLRRARRGLRPVARADNLGPTGAPS